jgi:ABC-2 type transport system ATP-binding protein
MTAPMISIENLEKSYGSTRALAGISFHVPKGQVVGFLGPNGAGKSTTMKILTGFVEASAGSVKVGDIDVSLDPVEARKRIGYLPESNPLYEEMMVQEYLEYMADVRQIKKSERQSRIESAVEACGLSKVRGKDISELSKGYRQRVGLAAAILHDPDLLILDEPTTGLDPNQVIEIRELIKQLGKEKTVLMSTHILPEVQATCSRVLIINDGKVVADDTPDSLTEATEEKAEGAELSIELLPRGGATPTLKELREVLAGLPGVKDVIAAEPEGEGAYAFTVRTGSADPRTALFDAAVEHGLILLRLEKKRVSLEDTFRRLTTKEAA